MQILLEVPEQHLVGESAEAISEHFKLYAALMMFRSGQLSAGAACELADIDRYTFLAECREHRIAAGYSPEELKADLKWLKESDSNSS